MASGYSLRSAAPCRAWSHMSNIFWETDSCNPASLPTSGSCRAKERSSCDRMAAMRKLVYVMGVAVCRSSFRMDLVAASTSALVTDGYPWLTMEATMASLASATTGPQGNSVSSRSNVSRASVGLVLLLDGDVEKAWAGIAGHNNERKNHTNRGSIILSVASIPQQQNGRRGAYPRGRAKEHILWRWRASESRRGTTWSHDVSQYRIMM
mmetsp:Transcript_27718/g.80000  ORF Transcript_27718/g.80000 Transcript_27718/m.80000 type:complete len:209 (+) Transcript_27718:543-1169(+)